MNHATLITRLAAAAGFLALLSLVFAASARAQILVSDYNLNRVVRLDADGANPAVLVAPAAGGLDQPHRARIGPDGLLYVASAGSDQILRYQAATGAFVDAFIGADSGLDYPVDFLFRPDGYLYVTSQQTHSVLRYSAATGQRDPAWLAYSPDLSAPSGLAFDDAGNLYVSGRFSYNLARFDAGTGAHELTFGDVPFALGVALLPDGRLLAAAGYGDNVQAFSAPASATPAQSTFAAGLAFPVGVELDPATATLLVANYSSGNVSRHALADGALLETLPTGDFLSGPNYFTVVTPAPVPEPASAAALLGLAALGRVILKRRRRASAAPLGIALAALAVGPIAPARAELLPIINPGFETPATPAGDFNVSAPGPLGWSAFGAINHSARSIGVLNPNGTALYPGGAPEGAGVGVVFLWDNLGDQTAPGHSPAGLQQTLSASLAANTRYTLDFWVGNIAEDRADPRHDDFSFAGFPGYRVELLAGGQVIAADENTLLPAEGAFVAGQVALSIGATHALAGQNLGIRLVNLNAAPGLEVNFDHIRLDATPVPEPASAALLLGLAATARLAGRRRRP